MTSAPRPSPDFDGALAALPLFPLPQATLFPGAVLPLHVFEPRYKTMIRDCLASHKSLAIVQVVDATVRDEHGHPKIATIAGAGTIIDHAELSEGRFNILVRGRARVRLAELPFEPPYRRAHATVIEPHEASTAELDVTALVATASAFVALVRRRDNDFELRLPQGASPSALADLCAHQLVIDADERQKILETVDISERLLRVTETLALQRLALSKDARDLN